MFLLQHAYKRLKLSNSLVAIMCICYSVCCQEWTGPDLTILSKNQRSLSGYSGLPYVVLAEYTYGVSNHFNVGILAGVTPQVFGVGVRMKSLIWRSRKSHRILFKAPVIYYPSTRDLGGEPWVLAWPSLNYELQLNNRNTIWLAAGYVVAATFSKTSFEKESTSDVYNPQNKNKTTSADWYTIGIGFSRTVSDRFQVTFECSPVFKGTKIAHSKNWVGGPPVIASFGWTYLLK